MSNIEVHHMERRGFPGNPEHELWLRAHRRAFIDGYVLGIEKTHRPAKVKDELKRDFMKQFYAEFESVFPLFPSPPVGVTTRDWMRRSGRCAWSDFMSHEARQKASFPADHYFYYDVDL
jgi:hypothetical protein